MTVAADRLGCVGLYAARMCFLAKNVLQAQEFGVPPGEDDRPWESSFQQAACEVYIETLPADYLERLCSVFKGCSLTMDEHAPPLELAGDWRVVQRYFDTASAALTAGLGLTVVNAEWEDPRDQSPTTPGVVYFDLLATYVSTAGIIRLVEAAVSDYLSASRAITTDQVDLLKSLALGHRIADIAARTGRSERQLYRDLRELWADLEVSNRHQAIAIASRSGWLD